MSRIRSIEELNEKLGNNRPQFLELWVESKNGKSICALINGNVGWLMCLRENGDAGFSLRCANYKSSPEAKVEYRLENGQIDEYPAAWALSDSEVRNALEHFIKHAEPAPWIVWHNDSKDGIVIGRLT